MAQRKTKAKAEKMAEKVEKPEDKVEEVAETVEKPGDKVEEKKPKAGRARGILSSESGLVDLPPPPPPAPAAQVEQVASPLQEKPIGDASWELSYKIGRKNGETGMLKYPYNGVNWVIQFERVSGYPLPVADVPKEVFDALRSGPQFGRKYAVIN